VVSIQTAINRKMPWKPDIVFIDEAHRARSNSYQEIVEACGDPVLIGITATPIRGDNKGLGGKLFTRMVRGPGIGDLIDQGYLVRPKVYTWPIDLSGIKITGGDYNQPQLDTKMSEAKLLGDVLREWQKRCSDRTTVLFASGIGHSKLLVDEVRAAGVKAEHIDGTTPKQDRESILYWLACGDIQVVSNFGVLCEGWDCPRVSALSIVRPTKSLGLYLQMAGRALRTYPGKEDCIILDHGGCAIRHGSPDEPREWDLSDDRVKITGDAVTKDVADSIDVCPDCGRVYERGEVETCECGYDFARKRRREAEVKAGELQALDERHRAMVAHQKTIYFNLMRKQRHAVKWDGTPYSPKYAVAAYNGLFGDWPPRRWAKEFEAMQQ
jgi:superfamily II DNA or RNA helicase